MPDIVRLTLATKIAQDAGVMALGYFKKLDDLTIECKGHQDFVSEADKNVETYVRDCLTKAFPGDEIIGEEQATQDGKTGFTWVIDPIDGTTNFINGIPAWTVVLAGVQDGKTEIGVIHDPVHNETFVAQRGQGAMLNGRQLVLADPKTLREGSIGVGYSNRTSTDGIRKLVDALVLEGSMFVRNASGALSLAYVASGRLLGYVEEHMNAWDYLAGQLLVAEAGGSIETQNIDDVLTDGGRVIVSTKAVFAPLCALCETAFYV